ncbi:nucleotide exchange factor GrpE [Kribbella sp. NPDC051718]|uniref:nucleotide exchange factor GrpE n=1 Tax=Kribbella sp. NPDC051718 TaxID=3155168 RepID=UPI003429B98F
METSTDLQTLTEELAGLRDMFRRRLLNDKAQQQVVDELSKRLDNADSRSAAAILAPVLHQLVLVLDRIDAEAPLASVRDELTEILTRSGVLRLGPTAGLPFDPRFHHAVARLEVTDPAGDGVVATELRPGYVIDGTVLRPAEVTVGQLPSTTSCLRETAGVGEDNTTGGGKS